MLSDAMDSQVNAKQGAPPMPSKGYLMAFFLVFGLMKASAVLRICCWVLIFTQMLGPT